MRASVLRGGPVSVRVIDDPVPGPGQLLVRSLACGMRTPQGWRIAERINAPLDGTDGHREMLAPSAEPVSGPVPELACEPASWQSAGTAAER